MTVTSNMIADVFAHTRKAEQEAFKITIALMMAKRKLEIATHRHLPTVEGKNVAQREANLAPLILKESGEVASLEENLSAAKLVLRLALLEVREVDYLLRLAEANLSSLPIPAEQ